MTTKTITIQAFESCDYRQVWTITERRNGAIYKTVHKGYCHKDRRQLEDELYTALSTKLTKQPTVTLELLS